MSATADGGAVAVTKPGHCKREVLIGKKIHVVKHSWRIHVCEVELVTTLLGEKYPHRTLNKKTSYVMNTEEALSSKGEEMAECVLKNRRDQFMRIQQQQQQQTGGRGSSSRISSSRSSKSKTSADSSGVVCPIISALRGGGDVAGKTFSEVVKKPPAEPRDGHEVTPTNSSSTSISLDCLYSSICRSNIYGSISIHAHHTCTYITHPWCIRCCEKSMLLCTWYVRSAYQHTRYQVTAVLSSF